MRQNRATPSVLVVSLSMRTPLARLYDKQFYKHMELPKKGTITVSFSKGVYTGMSIEMGTLETARHQQNETFYGKQVKISQILFKKDTVDKPEDSLIPNIHKKFALLAKGDTWVAGELDRSKSSHVQIIADQPDAESMIVRSSFPSPNMHARTHARTKHTYIHIVVR